MDNTMKRLREDMSQDLEETLIELIELDMLEAAKSIARAYNLNPRVQEALEEKVESDRFDKRLEKISDRIVMSLWIILYGCLVYGSYETSEIFAHKAYNQPKIEYLQPLDNQKIDHSLYP